MAVLTTQQVTQSDDLAVTSSSPELGLNTGLFIICLREVPTSVNDSVTAKNNLCCCSIGYFLYKQMSHTKFSFFYLTFFGLNLLLVVHDLIKLKSAPGPKAK